MQFTAPHHRCSHTQTWAQRGVGPAAQQYRGTGMHATLELSEFSTQGQSSDQKEPGCAFPCDKTHGLGIQPNYTVRPQG